MKYKKIINSSYNLHIIKTDKFKTVTVQVNFKRETKKEEIVFRNMVINMLCESNGIYKTKREFDIATEELYNLYYKSMNYMSGKYSISVLDITFLNEKYTEEGMFDKSIDFLYNIIFNPNIVDDNGVKKFEEKNYEISYNLLKEQIESIKENPSYYARVRMLENLDKDSYASYRSNGYIEDLDNVNRENLYDYYLSMLNDDMIDIFIIGDVNISQVERIIYNKFSILKSRKRHSDSHFVTCGKCKKIRKVVKEKAHINQSKLLLGYKIDNLNDFELRYVLSVYSYILGGSPDSKLFKNVREKHSLCYNISSTAHPLYSLLTISAGINKRDFRKTVSLINKETTNMRKGKFTDDDIVKAKITYINSLNELEDNPQSIIGLYSGIEYLRSDTIDERIIKINKVTFNDVKTLANKIHLDTIYMLEGDIRGK